jgi:hypothetical protein
LVVSFPDYHIQLIVLLLRFLHRCHSILLSYFLQVFYFLSFVHYHHFHNHWPSDHSYPISFSIIFYCYRLCLQLSLTLPVCFDQLFSFFCFNQWFKSSHLPPLVLSFSV